MIFERYYELAYSPFTEGADAGVDIKMVYGFFVEMVNRLV